MKVKISVLFTVLLFVLMTSQHFAQQDNKPRASLKASVSQTIGVDTDIKIVYSRPGVKGRKIWGDVVPYGMAPGTEYTKNKPFPWRGGANENTTIEFSKDVMIENTKLPAGKYSLHFIPGEKEWVVIFNKANDQWGSYTYNKDNDALRINVTPVKVPHQEWLMYGFDDLAATSATAFLQWEQLRIPFKISVAG